MPHSVGEIFGFFLEMAADIGDVLVGLWQHLTDWPKKDGRGES